MFQLTLSGESFHHPTEAPVSLPGLFPPLTVSLQRAPALYIPPGCLLFPQFLGSWWSTPSSFCFSPLYPSVLLDLSRKLQRLLHTQSMQTFMYSLPSRLWEGRPTPAEQLSLHASIRATSQPAFHLLALLQRIRHQTPGPDCWGLIVNL